MTKTGISKILEETGNYSLNTLIPMSEVSSISFSFNEYIYLDDTTHLYFKSSGNVNLLLVYNGITETDGKFKSDEKPILVVPFSKIVSFQLVNGNRGKSPYKYGRSI